MTPAPVVTVVEFTDPGCPWAFSAEPFRWRMLWLYGDQFDWQVRMVGLAATAEEQAAKGFTPERLASAYKSIAREHRMPIDAAPRTRLSGTLDACRAVVAARLHQPAATRALLRALRLSLIHI